MVEQKDRLKMYDGKLLPEDYGRIPDDVKFSIIERMAEDLGYMEGRCAEWLNKKVE